MGKSIRIFHPTKKIAGNFNLPGSKSESNRALIINKLSGNKIKIENLSPAEDTQNLIQLLDKKQKELDVKDAGTSMRFLTAYFCVLNKNKIITGSPRMKERPIGKLIDALRDIGFKIFYVKNKGFPPVEIIPSERLHLKYETTIEANESSQFVSALLMIAPLFPDGLIIKLKGSIVSKPYIEMTLSIMESCGVQYEWKKSVIKINHQQYQPSVYKVEPDWTSASYWYSMAALSNESDIFLAGLKENSFQGDKIISEWMKLFGVSTYFSEDGIRIKKESNPVNRELSFDFSQHPDLVQTILVIAAAKNINLTITGIQSLRIKETDRILALQSELKKIGAVLYEKENNCFYLESNFVHTTKPVETFNDHRMAMAFAPLALLNNLCILQPSVVSKSYPEFWNQLTEAGFLNG